MINNLGTMGDKDVLLRDNVTELPLLEDRTSSQHNCVIVAIVALSILCDV